MTPVPALPGARGRSVGAAPPEALRSVAAPQRLVRRYGTEAPAVAALALEAVERLAPDFATMAA